MSLLFGNLTTSFVGFAIAIAQAEVSCATHFLKSTILIASLFRSGKWEYIRSCSGRGRFQKISSQGRGLPRPHRYAFHNRVAVRSFISNASANHRFGHVRRDLPLHVHLGTHWRSHLQTYQRKVSPVGHASGYRLFRSARCRRGGHAHSNGYASHPAGYFREGCSYVSLVLMRRIDAKACPLQSLSASSPRSSLVSFSLIFDHGG